jgi:hypothetical protein
MAILAVTAPQAIAEFRWKVQQEARRAARIADAQLKDAIKLEERREAHRQDLADNKVKFEEHLQDKREEFAHLLAKTRLHRHQMEAKRVADIQQMNKQVNIQQEKVISTNIAYQTAAKLKAYQDIQDKHDLEYRRLLSENA